jgi:hypothetical protein
LAACRPPAKIAAKAVSFNLTFGHPPARTPLRSLPKSLLMMMESDFARQRQDERSVMCGSADKLAELHRRNRSAIGRTDRTVPAEEKVP